MTNEERLKKIRALTREFQGSDNTSHRTYVWGLQDGLRYDFPIPAGTVCISDLGEEA